MVAVEPFQRELDRCEQNDAIACPLGVMDDARPSVIIACDRKFAMRRNYVLAITRPTTSMKIAWRKRSFVDKCSRSTTTIVLQQDECPVSRSPCVGVVEDRFCSEIATEKLRLTGQKRGVQGSTMEIRAFSGWSVKANSKLSMKLFRNHY